ncbi:EamA family transporter [Saccharomonospora cyanea]|uniref:Putative permease, DMT superfamily n=1 Tax=Saccharomonospora cyanea NA-134 TaxID=882082 RepID=H5XMX9_9PSEU|nr:EamA family transporter [Saccharomonospora cyanea]EHR62104.1 putative permease, DMT superfamily [Saccharomonospora cyanea NA-134]
MTISTGRRALDAVPAPLVFVVSGISMYVGAALAVWLFDVATPAGVAWLRCLGAALILLLWRRPGRQAWRGRALLLAGTFGVVTAGMNVLFYEAIARLPLGTAVAIEFAGPVVVAALGSRGVRDYAALAGVTVGVVLIADVQWEGSPGGVAFALGAAVAWAAYIVLGRRVALAGSGVDSLAVGFAVATVVLSPLVLGTTAVWGEPDLLAFAIGVGLLATVVPYALDQVVLRRVGQARFALLLALLPVTAAAIGFVVLGQVPTLVEALGILAVVIGVVLRSNTSRGERAR